MGKITAAMAGEQSSFPFPSHCQDLPSVKLSSKTPWLFSMILKVITQLCTGLWAFCQAGLWKGVSDIPRKRTRFPRTASHCNQGKRRNWWETGLRNEVWKLLSLSLVPVASLSFSQKWAKWGQHVRDRVKQSSLHPSLPMFGYKLAYINVCVHPCMCACVSVCVWGRSREYRKQSGPDAVAMVIIISFQRGGWASFLFNYVYMTWLSSKLGFSCPSGYRDPFQHLNMV